MNISQSAVGEWMAHSTCGQTCGWQVKLVIPR